MLTVLVTQEVKIFHNILQIYLFASVFAIDLASLLVSIHRSLKFRVELPQFPWVLFLVGNQGICRIVVWVVVSTLSVPSVWVIQHLDGVDTGISFVLWGELSSLSWYSWSRCRSLPHWLHVAMVWSNILFSSALFQWQFRKLFNLVSLLYSLLFGNFLPLLFLLEPSLLPLLLQLLLPLLSLPLNLSLSPMVFLFFQSHFMLPHLPVLLLSQLLQPHLSLLLNLHHLFFFLFSHDPLILLFTSLFHLHPVSFSL